MKHLSQIIFCILLALSAGEYSYASPTHGIVIYYSSQNSYQKSLASAINNNLNDVFSSIPIRFITNNDLSAIHPGDLIISIGNQKKIDADIGVLKNDIIYINDAESNEHVTRHNTSYVNVKITQPPCRQLDLISIINKQWKRIGFLTSSADDTRLVQLRACSKKLGMTINAVQIKNGDLPAAIEKALFNSDALLALPDYRIYNRRSVKDILLSAYRLRIPVIGFSKNFVNAGAIAAAYSTPDQIARQLVSIILDRMKNDKFPDNGNIYPEYFSVSTNKQVANAMSLTLPDEHSIMSSIQSMEAKQ
jgi:ABC-type uncharacterized transport system substrate-binding protein